jgi:hypothetical protein
MGSKMARLVGAIGNPTMTTDPHHPVSSAAVLALDVAVLTPQVALHLYEVASAERSAEHARSREPRAAGSAGSRRFRIISSQAFRGTVSISPSRRG